MKMHFWLGLQAGPISNSVVHQSRKYNRPFMQSMTEICESKLFLNIPEFEQIWCFLVDSAPPQQSVLSLGEHVQLLLIRKDCTSVTMGRAGPVIFFINFVKSSCGMSMFLISNSTTILVFQQNLQNISLLFGPLYYWTERSCNWITSKRSRKLDKWVTLVLHA